MNTAECIQETSQDGSLESVNERPVNNHHITPNSPRQSALELSRRQSRSDDNAHIISTNDILNHDYNQLKIDEGRQQRMNSKRENTQENDLFVTHVTLNLDIVENRPQSASTWKYNSIKKNNNFANAVKANPPNTQRPNTNRSHMSNDSKQNKEPFLFLSSNRYSTNASECSDNFNIPETNSTHTNTFSQMSNRTKTKISSRESSAMGHQQQVLRPQQNYPQQRVNFEKSVSRKTRPPSNFSNHSKPMSYMDIIRSKSSAESCSSIHSNHNHNTNDFQAASKRNNSTRHSYTVAEFNKFKNKLLKNHSRNYYLYDSINLNNEFLKNNGEQQQDNHKPLINQTQPTLIQHGYQIVTDNVDISHKPKPERQLSQIKSIYETIQRANNSKIFSLDMRRSNYLNNMRNTNNVLTSSLMVQKMSQRS